ncbi:hypothetical protein BDZ91DRAFT_746271 [Kalaharituber pfeilii]|nr:hypothetical protein BDZ91DRAFT_746271 [Kalaharituber pfeilii]
MKNAIETQKHHSLSPGLLKCSQSFPVAIVVETLLCTCCSYAYRILRYDGCYVSLHLAA